MSSLIVPQQVPRVSYPVGATPNGTFPVPFVLPDASSLAVIVNGTPAVLALNPTTEFEFSFAGVPIEGGFNGGTITLGAPIANGVVLIERRVPIERLTDFPTPSRALDIKSLNRQLDASIMLLQQIARDLGRTVRLNPDDPDNASLVLPPKDVRAGKIPGFDTQGGLIMVDADSTTYALPYTGAIDLTVAERLAENLSAVSFGAKGDGITDDTAALQALFNAAATSDRVPFIGDGVFRTSGPLVLPAAAQGLVMRGVLEYAGTAPVIALRLGGSGDERVGERAFLGLRVRRLNQSDWSSEADIGIVAGNLDGCWLEVREARGFTIGVQTLGDERGFEDSTLELGRLIDNKIALDIRAATASGWNNGVRYIGGHFAVSSGTNPGESTIGARFSREPDAYNNHNSHTFIGPNFELAQSGRAEAVPFLVETGGRGLHAIGVRMEACKPYVARHTGAMRDALYEVIFNSPDSYLVDVAYDATATRAGAIVRPLHAAAGQQQHHRVIAAVQNVRAGAFRSSAGNTGFEGLAVIGGTSGNWSAVNLNGAGDAGWTLAAETVTVLTGNRGLAFPVRTLGCRDFVLGLGGDDGLRPVVRLFDASGNLLDDSAHRVLGSEQTFDWSASQGWWQASAGLSDGALNRQVHVRLEGNSIAYAQIGIARVGADQVVRAMSLACDPRFRPQVLTGPTTGWGTRETTFSATYDPPDLAGGGTHQTNVSVTGAAPGDHVQVGFSVASTAVVFIGTIGASGTVTVVAWNRSGSNVNLAAGTLFGQVIKARL